MGRLYSIRILITVVVLAILFSAIQFLYNRSLWYDEALLALNIINKSHWKLLQPLDRNQVAPIFYLQITKLFSTFTPNSEHGLRLFPLICFWVAVILFGKISRRLFKNNSPIILLAVSLFALNSNLLYFSSELKQYMVDVMISVIFIYLLLKPFSSTKKKYVTLALAGVFSVFLSNIAPLVLFAAGLSLLIGVIHENRDEFMPLMYTSFAWLMAFSAYYLLFIHGHPSRNYMLSYWENQQAFASLNVFSDDFFQFMQDKMSKLGNRLFPGAQFLMLPIMMIPLLGCISLLKRNEYRILIYLIAPALLHLILSAVRIYPIGGRFILYLLPGLILLSLEGLNYLYEMWWYKGKEFVLKGFGIVVTGLLLVLVFHDFPMKRQEIKVPLTYIEHSKSDHDGVYVYYGANPAFSYYSQTGFFVTRPIDNIILGGRARNDKVKLANEVDQLDGPFWLLFSNIFKDEEEFVLKYLQKQGLEPVDQVKAKGASAYRFIF